MKRVFLDTDIVLDLLAERHPFYAAAASIFTLAETGRLEVCVSSLTFSHLHYILRKLVGGSEARKSLRKLKLIVTILPVDGAVIEQALSSEFRDFEDAIQYFAAAGSGIQHIVTHNVKDYIKSARTICPADEYVRLWNASQRVRE